MDNEILDMAKIICKTCFDKMDSVFDCNANKRPCESAIKQAENLYGQGYRRIYTDTTLCPVCGKKMDETETGKQYCKGGEDKYKC